MEKVEAQPFMRSLIIVAVIATAFSSFTLWLLESWIKYPLFLFEIFTIILFYLIINDYDIKLTTKDMGIQNLHLGLFANMLLIISASSLLIINALQIQAEFIQLVLALLCTSLLSGYALLNILGLTRYFSRLETVVLSYILSYAFTGFVTLAAFSIGKDARTSFVKIPVQKHRLSGSTPSDGVLCYLFLLYVSGLCISAGNGHIEALCK